MLWHSGIILACVLAEYLGRIAFSGLTGISHNPGAAFGIMGTVPGLALWLSGIAFVIIVLVIIFGRVKPFTRLGLSIMAGGALSNLLERIILGYVLDWIPVPFFDLYYNLADVFISLGALTAFISSIKENSPDSPEEQ